MGKELIGASTLAEPVRVRGARWRRCCAIASPERRGGYEHMLGQIAKLVDGVCRANSVSVPHSSAWDAGGGTPRPG